MRPAHERQCLVEQLLCGVGFFVANIDNRLQFEHANPGGAGQPTVLRTELPGGGDVRFGLRKVVAISLARRFALIGG